MRKLFSTKKRIVATVGTAALVAAMATAAFAYFTSTGTGSGYATVGTQGWSVSNVSTSGGPLFPNSGSENVNYSLTNTGDASQTPTSLVVTVNTDGGGGIYNLNTSTWNDSCLAGWFSVTNDLNGYVGVSIGAGATVSDYSTITLVDSGGNQNACQGVAPALTITAN
jgi:hypothetical protein